VEGGGGATPLPLPSKVRKRIPSDFLFYKGFGTEFRVFFILTRNGSERNFEVFLPVAEMEFQRQSVFRVPRKNYLPEMPTYTHNALYKAPCDVSYMVMAVCSLYYSFLTDLSACDRRF
jgi:hypothetical protein